jgi:hypothetical protein
MKFPPLDPGKPVTNKQLAEQNTRLHECLHNVGERVDKLVETVRQDRHDGTTRDQVMDVRIARIEGRLGVDPNKIHQGPALAGVRPWKALLAVAGAFAGIQVAYQVFVPMIVAAAKAFNAAMMGG